MELSGENDPLGQMINGDQATEQDVTVLETMAFDLLGGEEGATQFYYTIAQEAGGPYVEVSTYTDGEFPEDVPIVSVGVIDENKTPLLHIEFDSKDEVSNIGFDERVVFGNSISSALEEVILCTDDNQEKQLLDQLYGLARALEDGNAKAIEEFDFEINGFEEDYDSVADGFRYLVDAKYTAVILIKEYGALFEQNSSLSIISNEAVTGTIPDDGPNKLYVGFEDRELGIGYYYEYGQDGVRQATATHLSENLDSDDQEPQVEIAEIDAEEEKLAVSAMTRMYEGKLAKLHIDLLIERLLDAELQNNSLLPE